MKLFILLIILFCSTQTGRGQNATYFDFDEVDYYSTNTSFDYFQFLRSKEQKTVHEILLLDILRASYPDSIVSNLDSSLLEVGFKRKIIGHAKFQEMRVIFSRKFEANAEDYSGYCIPVYRDILIFKRDNVVTGVANLCFSCPNYFLIGGKDEKPSNLNIDFKTLKQIIQ